MTIKNPSLSFFAFTIVALLGISGCTHKSTIITDLPTKPKKPTDSKTTTQTDQKTEAQNAADATPFDKPVSPSTLRLCSGQGAALTSSGNSGQPSHSKKAKKQKKYFRDLTYEDLQESKTRLLAEGRQATAIKHIEKMIPLCNNIQELRDLTIELADLFFETGNLRKAEELYSQFGQLYPGDQNIEYATYKSILCNYWMTLDTERDQSLTRTTVNLSKKFLARSDIFNQYTDEVQKILVDSQSKIFESEINVFKFYLNHGDELSAKTRLANIQKEFLEDMPHIEAQLIVLACDLARTFDRQKLLQEKQAELAAKFPNYLEQQQAGQSIVLAANEKVDSFVDKF